jgi:hypothetical protein
MARAASGASWGSSVWNWGSASGTAHDAAGPLRARLRTEAARAAFVADAASGAEEALAVELALALAWQRASRSGLDAQTKAVYARLTAGAYEGDPEAWRTELAAAAGCSCDEPVTAVMKQALESVRFVALGC